MHTLDDAGPSNMEESVKRVSPGCTWNISLRKKRSGFILTGKTILTLLYPDPNLNLDLNLDQFNNAT